MFNAWIKLLLDQKWRKWDLDSNVDSQTTPKLRSNDYVQENESIIYKVAIFMDPMQATQSNMQTGGYNLNLEWNR